MASVAGVVRAKTVLTCDTGAGQNGITFDRLGQVARGAVAFDGGIVRWIGSSADLPAEWKNAEVHDFPDCVVVPGFVDAHAHPLFAGDRVADFDARVGGAAAPGGMMTTVRLTRDALRSPGAFWETTIAPRLKMMLAHGTTTLETKTGYALTRDGEFAMLDLIRAHREEEDSPRLLATFLGAHTLPPEFASHSDFVQYLIAECLPVAASHGAAYADAFCEPGVFSPDETRSYLEAARRHGLRLRVHCDEMAYAGAARMAAELAVDAVDHCNYVRETEIAAIAASGAVTVACPATIAFLDLPTHAPVRSILEGGGTVALASDYNPGTSPCFNLQTVAYYGRSIFGLRGAEALYAVTVAAARSLRADAGRLKVGSPADCVALQIESPEEFGWQFGGNLARAVFLGGKRL